MDTNNTKLADQVLNNPTENYYENKELISWPNILLIAVYNYNVWKFIIEVIKDVQKASTWGETLIAIANCGNNGLTNVHRHDVCTLFRNSFQIQK